MQVGFNTNIPYKGKVYHVQTEDTGESFSIISLLYYKGAILASRKTDYSGMRDESGLKEKIREMMREQHKGLIKELIHGKITGDADETGKVMVSETGEVPEPSDKEEVAKVQKPVVGQEPAAEKKAAADTGKKYKSLDDILIDFILDKAREK